MLLGPDQQLAEECSGSVPYTTNQQMELTAIKQAVASLAVSDQDKVTIVTDSMYSIHCLTKWHKTWSVNGWRTSGGSRVKHEELIRSILDITVPMGDRLQFRWVKGHDNNRWNERVDHMARAAAMHQDRGVSTKTMTSTDSTGC